jgi:hypothetical protein
MSVSVHVRGFAAAAVAASAVWSLVACGGTDPYGDPYAIICSPGQRGCDGAAAGRCNDRGSAWEGLVPCEGHTPVCVPDLGCVACVPGARRCQGSSVLACEPDGSSWTFVETCVGETFCHDGACGGDCARAAVFRSYEGCEYRAATLMNSQLDDSFLPAIVVSNRNSEPVTVTVARRGYEESFDVPPRSTATHLLEWVAELKGSFGEVRSANVAGAAYVVESSLPVTVYQFNPLEYRLPHDCGGGDPVDGLCFSYSNDASLLLPITALTQNYMVMSRASLGIVRHYVELGTNDELYSPSVLAVVNPNDTEVDVTVVPSAPIAGGAGIDRLDAGEEATFTVAPNGVLQLAAESPNGCVPDWTEPATVPCGGYTCRYSYCDLVGHDLTGTAITATAPVAVFGAHDCDFIPFNRWACDHLEEQIFPFETWGARYVVARAYRENGEPDVVRILSGVDGNVVRFDPPEVHAEVTLARGEHVELEAHAPFALTADGPVLVGQFLVGQNYNDISGEGLPPGDPAFALAVPIEQWRTSYNFLAPTTYDRSFVNIVADKNAFVAIELDGASLAGEDWQHVGRSDFVALTLEVEAGSHGLFTADEEGPFGILVYGYGQYTSYMYPGGLDLEQIAVW